MTFGHFCHYRDAIIPCNVEQNSEHCHLLHILVTFWNTGSHIYRQIAATSIKYDAIYNLTCTSSYGLWFLTVWFLKDYRYKTNYTCFGTHFEVKYKTFDYIPKFRVGGQSLRSSWKTCSVRIVIKSSGFQESKYYLQKFRMHSKLSYVLECFISLTRAKGIDSILLKLCCVCSSIMCGH
jgi:hypothetical protein